MSLPTHIAIIPDGNRRWAKERGLPAFLGHKEGAKTTEKILTAALKADIRHLTFWGVSLSNVTKRDKTEIAFLYTLFTAYFKKIARAKLIHEHHVHMRALGEWGAYFPTETKTAIQKAVAATAAYHDHELTFLLAYDGTAEMVQAVNHILAEECSQQTVPTVTGDNIKQHLYTKDLPPVDLVIRTGNEPHLSTGFMMWDTANAELYFSDKLWPAFTVGDFHAALEFYQKTDRRLGK